MNLSVLFIYEGYLCSIFQIIKLSVYTGIVNSRFQGHGIRIVLYALVGSVTVLLK
jgi:hypothetical protein